MKVNLSFLDLTRRVNQFYFIHIYVWHMPCHTGWSTAGNAAYCMPFAYCNLCGDANTSSYAKLTVVQLGVGVVLDEDISPNQNSACVHANTVVAEILQTLDEGHEHEQTRAWACAKANKNTNTTRLAPPLHVVQQRPGLHVSDGPQLLLHNLLAARLPLHNRLVAGLPRPPARAAHARLQPLLDCGVQERASRWRIVVLGKRHESRRIEARPPRREAKSRERGGHAAITALAALAAPSRAVKSRRGA